MVPGRLLKPDVIVAGCGRSRELAVIVHSVRITLDTRAEHQPRLVHVLAPESLSFGAVEGLEVDPVLRIRRIEFIRAYGDLNVGSNRRGTDCAEGRFYGVLSLKPRLDTSELLSAHLNVCLIKDGPSFVPIRVVRPSMCLMYASKRLGSLT